MEGLIQSSITVHILDLLGTMIFAVTGAIKAIEHKLDVLGIVVLSSSTGLAGGIIRDAVLGRTPPSALIDPSYLLLTTMTAIGVFFLYPYLKNLLDLFLKFDALGLGVFSIFGAMVALNSYGFNLTIMIFAGLITAVGGGIIRDILVNEIPLVLKKELYASLSFVGILLFFILLYFGATLEITIVICIPVITVLRLMAIRFSWNLPTRISRDPRQ